MKIKTAKQLLITLILINVLVFSLIGAVLWYYDGPQILGPLAGAAAASTAVQYILRKKQLPQA
ncbi:hypothetical protein ACX0HA_05785 [Flavobacterium hauense]